MSEIISSENVPKLPFLPEKCLSLGVQVQEIDLAVSVSPKPSFRASRITVEPNCSSSAENHFVHEMWVVLQGKGKLCYDNQEIELNQDNFVYFEPYKTHQLINDGSETMVVFSIYWK